MRNTILSHRTPQLWIPRLLALVATLTFLATSFREGWNRAETDFPNYYTAAVLVRRGEPLHKYYDWKWFQRQMNYAGVDNQLGAYVPNTPVTMFPMMLIAQFPVQTAKRVWLTLNLGFLAGTIWLLSRITQFSSAEITLLVFAGYGSLHRNFVLGQYYVLVLLLLVLGFYVLWRSRPYFGGLAFGSACALKLYGAPLFLYFAAKRERRALAGFLTAILCFVLAGIAVFGFRDVGFFITHILPRAMQGEIADPYNPGNNTVSTLLRRTFVPEATLNPHPLLNAPVVCFFLQPLFVLGVLIFPLMALHKSKSIKHDFAWFFIASMLVLPFTASYHFIILLLPIVLLLEDCGALQRVLLIACYVLLTLPLRPAWSFLFPKIWLLIFLFVFAGRHYVRLIQPTPALIAAMLVVLTAAASATLRVASYRQEPAQRSEPIAVQRGATYSSSPAILRSGIAYEAIGKDRYILRWLHGGQIDDFSFAGEAFNPAPVSVDGPIYFELVAHRESRAMLLDPITQQLRPQAGLGAHADECSTVSPDGKWIAFTGSVNGTTQIFLRRVAGTKVVSLTGGYCNSFSPAWELDSKSIIFASDCGRGIGLPSLYRARLAGIHLDEAAFRPPARLK